MPTLSPPVILASVLVLVAIVAAWLMSRVGVALLGGTKTGRTVLLAVRSLWLHKLRASLSVLGIVIGTSAVIALMAFGKGSMQDALDDIKRQGATNIIVAVSSRPTTRVRGTARWSRLTG